jgi:hypothetical protein
MKVPLAPSFIKMKLTQPQAGNTGESELPDGKKDFC